MLLHLGSFITFRPSTRERISNFDFSTLAKKLFIKFISVCKSDKINYIKGVMNFDPFPSKGFPIDE